MWKGLPPETKACWKAAAERVADDFPVSHGRLTGYTLYVHCVRNCLMVGAEPPVRPPGGRPAAPRRIELLPAGDPGKFSFRIYHGVSQCSLDSYRVTLSLTPGSRRNCRAPETRNKRLAKGFGAASGLPLPPSGGIVEAVDCRFEVPPGKRFGVWVRIVRVTDGMASGEVFLDLMRTGEVPGPAAPEGDGLARGASVPVGAGGAPGIGACGPVGPDASSVSLRCGRRPP